MALINHGKSSSFLKQGGTFTVIDRRNTFRGGKILWIHFIHIINGSDTLSAT